MRRGDIICVAGSFSRINIVMLFKRISIVDQALALIFGGRYGETEMGRLVHLFSTRRFI